MTEKYRSWPLDRIERALEQAQREHDAIVAKSSKKIADLMAARDAKAARGVDDEQEETAWQHRSAVR